MNRVQFQAVFLICSVINYSSQPTAISLIVVLIMCLAFFLAYQFQDK
jgi:hypothetical protein